MDHNSSDRLTLARRFLEPSNSTHRQYEALRAFFVDGLPSAQAATRFGYTPGSFRVLLHQFRAARARLLYPDSATRSANRQEKAAARSGRRPSEAESVRARHQPGLPAMERPSARQLSPPSWRKKASPSCRDDVTRSDLIILVPPWPTLPTSAQSTSRRGTSAPSLAACSSSCRIWCRPTWTRSWLVAAFLARR